MDVTGSTVNPYGVMILSKHPIKQLSWLIMPTGMFRKALIAEYLINNEQFLVTTVHLESLANAPLREEQLKYISKVLIPCAHSLFMGDFNIDSTQSYTGGEPTENNNIANYYPPSKFLDVWPTLHPDQIGYTFDSKHNEMLRPVPAERMRYDRIFLGSENTNGNKWKATHIEILGTVAIENQKEKIYPSDHFGLLADFSREPVSK